MQVANMEIGSLSVRGYCAGTAGGNAKEIGGIQHQFREDQLAERMTHKNPCTGLRAASSGLLPVANHISAFGCSLRIEGFARICRTTSCADGGLLVSVKNEKGEFFSWRLRR